MDPKFTPQSVESRIYQFWEQSKLLQAPPDGKPYTVLMPPPNANASLHAGHGMYTVDDIMIRYKRLHGYSSLWVPGLDHAGFETQFVYEKHLAKQGKSRMDFDRETFYANVYQFVKDNSGLIYKQFKRLGFLADWDRSVFTLDEHVLERVFETFAKMEREDIVYRDHWMVQYCTFCGTSLAELEVEHIERVDPLYYMKYGPFTLATVRPETKFGDTAVAVNPKDKRYKSWIGKQVQVEGLHGVFNLTVIADEFVDPKFGTGVVKVTPAHDPNDFEIGKRHNLQIKQVINLDGRLNELTGPYCGLKVKKAREKVAEDLQKKGLIDKIDTEYTHSVSVCYKCKRDLEPMIIPNWFVRVKPLKEAVINAVKKDQVKFHPKKYKKQMLQWLDMMHDWPISRQIAWGIRIPIWYDIAKNPDTHLVFLDKSQTSRQGQAGELVQKFSLEEIEAGLQKLSAPKNASYTVSKTKPGASYLQETDTFDTWFSSGQWPLVTLKDHERRSRFPTDMMGTLSDILKFWISRMIMFSLYIHQEVPFRHVYLWSMVADAKGVKMSKSKGNVINPIDLVDQYGADAFRAALLFGGTQGGQVNLGQDKVIGMRNFTNKLWNIGRFLYMSEQPGQAPATDATLPSPPDIVLKELKKEITEIKKKYTRSMDGFKFSQALGILYEFIWHRFADYYIEQLKHAMRSGDSKTKIEMKKAYFESLQMIHPFMPFVSEAIWQVFHGPQSSILDRSL